MASPSRPTNAVPTPHRSYRGERSNCVILVVRKFKLARVLGSAAYTFLGNARYVSHEGSRPMSITWALNRPIPAKYL